ncbi:bacteriocin immunity protein [Clostridium sp.]|uniref:bacteriocin immunity protein n=1 Tax=Clostridium sp. TaxID=1506 RepID=UPI003D6D6170
MENKFNRVELIELVEKIMNAKGTEKEIDDMIEKLEKNVPNPEVSDLVFWNKQNVTAE